MKKMATLAMTAMLVAGAGSALVMSPMTALAEDDTTEASTRLTARSPAQWATDALEGLVNDGTITQEQSDRVVAALGDAGPPREPGDRGRGGPGGPDREEMRATMDQVASLLGLSAQELRNSAGEKSLADLASEKNIDVQRVIDVFVAASNESIDERLSSGEITQDQADELEADGATRASDMVNGVGPHAGPPRGFESMTNS